jgi:hypothetical protein
MTERDQLSGSLKFKHFDFFSDENFLKLLTKPEALEEVIMKNLLISNSRSSLQGLV